MSARREIDWTRKLVSSHNPPRPAIVLPDQPLLTKRKRVAVPNQHYASYEEWSKLSVTTWLYDECGNCGTDDKSPSELDLQYADEATGESSLRRVGG